MVVNRGESVHMKKTICIIITTCLIICSASFTHEPIHAEASAATYTAVEALQVLLAALGIRTNTHISSDDVNLLPLIVGTLNNYKNGLGNAVAHAITISKGTLQLTKSVVDDLMGWRDETYTESTDYSKSFSINVAIDKLTFEKVKELCPAMQGIIYTYDGDSTSINGRFLEFVDNAKKAGFTYFSIIHNVKRYFDYSTPYYRNYIFVCASKVNTPFRYDGGYNSVFTNDSIVRYIQFEQATDTSGYFRPMREEIGVGMYVGSDRYATYYPMVANEAITPINTSIASAAKDLIKAGVYVPITKSSVLSNDKVIGNTTITIPANVGTVLDGVRDDTLPFPDALLDFGVIAVDKTDTVAVEKAIADVKSGTGAIEDYKVNLVDFFPFCLPFDFYHCIALLNAEPQAPEFDFSLPVGYKDGEVIWESYHISLDIFSPVAEVVRKFELLAFMLGLIVITRDKFIRS